MRWLWPLPNDLDTQTWPRYGQDVTPYQKWSFYVNSFKVKAQTDRHTDMMKKLPLPHTWEVKIKSTWKVHLKTKSTWKVKSPWKAPEKWKVHEKHLKSEKHMKTTWKPHKNCMKTARFSWKAYGFRKTTCKEL